MSQGHSFSLKNSSYFTVFCTKSETFYSKYVTIDKGIRGKKMRKIGQIYSKPSVKIQDLENKQTSNSKIDTFLSYSRMFVQDGVPIKHNALLGISSKEVEKTFWLKLRTKCCYKP